MVGWLKLYRSLQSNPLWKIKPFSKGQAWVDLLMLAQFHDDGKVTKRGITVDLVEGEVGRSEVELADRWGWSRNKVRRYVNGLKTEQMVEQKNCGITNVIVIKNWHLYQGGDTENETENGTVNETHTKKYTKNKRIKDIPENDFSGEKKLHDLQQNNPDDPKPGSKYLPPEGVKSYKTSTRGKKVRYIWGQCLRDFEIFWDKFNNKTGKAEAAEAWRKIYTVELFPVIMNGVDGELVRRSEMLKKNPDHTPVHPSTWLNQRRYEDYEDTGGHGYRCDSCQLMGNPACKKLDKNNCIYYRAKN